MYVHVRDIVLCSIAETAEHACDVMWCVVRILDHPRTFAGNDTVRRNIDPKVEAEKLEYCAPEVIGQKLPGPPFDIW